MLAYIDDSVDEGTLGKGSRWLVFGCAMVGEADAALVREVVQGACVVAGGGRPKWLHFRDMNHDDRHGCIEIVKNTPWLGVIVGSDTTRVRPESGLGNPRLQYNYTARYVIERISALATELHEPATIYFEHRRNFSLASFREYMQRVMGSRINPQVIDPARIHQMPKGQDEILCLADALAYAAYRALEPHRVWRRYERSYLDALDEKLWRGPQGKENVHNWGLVLRPTDLWGSDFIRDYPWLRDLRKK